MRNVPVKLRREDIEILPINSRERGVMEAVLRDGGSFDPQRVLGIAAKFRETPSSWYFFKRGMGRLLKAGVIPRNPTVGISGPSMEEKAGKVITQEEYVKLSEAARGTELEYLITSMWMTGLALVDACLLDWKDVDLESQMILKKRTKMAGRKGGDCIIPLDPNGALLKMLHARREFAHEYEGHYPSVNGAHYVDQWSATRYLRGTRGKQDIYWMFKKLKERTGVDCDFHDFRRTTATVLLRKMDPIHTAMVTGHSSLDTLKRYIVPDKEVIREKVMAAYGAI